MRSRRILLNGWTSKCAVTSADVQRSSNNAVAIAIARANTSGGIIAEDEPRSVNQKRYDQKNNACHREREGTGRS